MAPQEEEPRQHGVKGAYVGGTWVDIEDCGEEYNIKDGSGEGCDKKCATCPRSRSRNTAAKADGSYDVIVIGAGCIGGAIARELAKSNLSVLVLEAADDVTQGATKGNSGIVHAGFDDVPGSIRAAMCWKGNQMFPALDRELHFGYQLNGSLVLANSEEERKHLNALMERGATNGVENLRIVEKEELFKLEPHINPNSVAALLAPDAGNLIPYEYAIALLENAVDNGVELRIRRAVVAIDKDTDASGMFSVKASHWEPKMYIDSVSQTTSTGGNLAVIILIVLGSSIIGLSKSAALDLTLALPLLEYLFSLGVSSQNLTMTGAALIVGAALLLVKPKASQASAGSKGEALASVGDGGRKVTVDEMRVGGTGAKTAVGGEEVEVETFRAKYIVNCAGSYSDKISAMIGDSSFKIKPRLGDYILLNRSQGHLAKHTLFPCPGPLGKGVLVQTTLWGNLILGPTARDVHLPETLKETVEDVQTFILSKCKALVPSFDAKETIHAFCGARSKSDRGDWIIEPSPQHPRFIQAAGIDSPGLAGSPAVAIKVVELLCAAGLTLSPNKTFNPKRAPIIVPKDGW
eukprot:CAMPEP_0119037820 /NCGR_PEP_ID=MMETSP1177-20130426/6331_1 /TAXON_ID=2985 /ORGANISM="Ochromonas sp, Strain CCMP1899" /LENGTH=576 /DNA_ID=CAMNT_0006999535 /DNA_START=76 /DNA_END=1803 /DNA_ORIENTATION=-